MSVTLPSAASIPIRTIGVAPLGVFLDLTGTTSTRTSKPLREVVYRTTWGETGLGNWAYGPQASKNESWGPVAAHIYETPGTYTVDIWAMDQDNLDNPGSSIAHTSLTITVQDPASPTVFGDANTWVFSTSGNFSGAPSYATTHRVTTSNWSTITAQIAPGRQIFLCAGETWTIPSAAGGGSFAYQFPSTGPGNFRSYGSANGGRATIVYTSGPENVLTFASGTSDWRIIDIEVNGNVNTNSGFAFAGNPGSAGGPTNRTLVLRCKARSTLSGYANDENTTAGRNVYNHDENFVHECDFDGNGAFAPPPSASYGLYTGGQRSSYQGNTAGNMIGQQTHVHRSWHARKVVFSNNNYHDPAPDRHCYKIQNEIDVPSIPDTDTVVCSQNTVTGGGPPIWPGPQNSTSDERVKNVILENNIYHCTSTQSNLWLEICAQNITVRNEKVFIETNSGASFHQDGCAVHIRGVEPAPTDIDIYNITIFNASLSHGDMWGVWIEIGVTNYRVKNVVLADGGSASDRRVVVDQGSSGGSVSNNVVTTNLSNFVNSGAGDLHLASGSALIGAGAAVPIFVDFDRRKRPQNTTYDQGAFERDNGETWGFSGGGGPPPSPVAFGVCA